MAKKYDVVAVVGEYKDNSGQTKKNYLNVGAVMSNDNGFYLLMDKTFNPAGLAEPGKRSIILSLFEPKERQQNPQQNQGGGMNREQPPFNMDDQIPFIYMPEFKEVK